jgi:hypothetical protein
MRATLCALFGSEVDDVRIVERSVFNLLHGRPLAVTRRGCIYLRGTAAEFFANPELVLHEYFHVLRQWAGGELTVLRYLTRCLRWGYWNNPFEIEARSFAARYVKLLRHP